jgi:hypothetical protein
MNAPIFPVAHDMALPRRWTLTEVEVLFELPFTELVFSAARVQPYRAAALAAALREDRRLSGGLRLRCARWAQPRARRLF